MGHEAFKHAYDYAKNLGYKSTASVFDEESLKYLLTFDVPFVKIANNRKLDYLSSLIPRGVKIIRSVSTIEEYKKTKIYNCDNLICVSNYPAKKSEYPSYLNGLDNLSDHTPNWDLYNEYLPNIYECHFKLEDSTGLDSGEFARTPEQLKEII